MSGMMTTLRARTSLGVCFGSTLALCVGATACGTDGASTSRMLLNADGDPVCATLDFEATSGGTLLEAGDSLHDAYVADGIHLDVWRHGNFDKPGFGVVFDSEFPTGGDDDLAYDTQGNLLISQEKFSPEDVANGFVDEPDDDACGAIFDFTFDQPMCMGSVTLLDIDAGEDRTKIKLLDDDDDVIEVFNINPKGDNSIDVIDLDETCGVYRMLIVLEGSGAVDDIALCPDLGEDTPECGDEAHDQDS